MQLFIQRRDAATQTAAQTWTKFGEISLLNQKGKNKCSAQVRHVSCVSFRLRHESFYSSMHPRNVRVATCTGTKPINNVCKHETSLVKCFWLQTGKINTCNFLCINYISLNNSYLNLAPTHCRLPTNSGVKLHTCTYMYMYRYQYMHEYNVHVHVCYNVMPCRIALLTGNFRHAFSGALNQKVWAKLSSTRPTMTHQSSSSSCVTSSTTDIPNSIESTSSSSLLFSCSPTTIAPATLTFASIQHRMMSQSLCTSAASFIQ